MGRGTSLRQCRNAPQRAAKMRRRQAGISKVPATEPDPACCPAGPPARRLPQDVAADRERRGAVRPVQRPRAKETAADTFHRPDRECGRKRNEIARVEHGSLLRSGSDETNATPRHTAPQSIARKWSASGRPSVAFAQRRARRQRHFPARCRAGSMSRYFHACSRFTCFLYPSTHGRTSVFSIR